MCTDLPLRATGTPGGQFAAANPSRTLDTLIAPITTGSTRVEFRAVLVAIVLVCSWVVPIMPVIRGHGAGRGAPGQISQLGQMGGQGLT